MSKGIYTPGQVSGLTGIPVRSIRRIVAKYPEAFSPGSNKPQIRRHRFTAEDVARLKLYREHSHNVSIREILSEYNSSELPKTGTESLIDTIQKLVKENKKLRREFDLHFYNHYELSASDLSNRILVVHQAMQDLKEEYKRDYSALKSSLAAELMEVQKKKHWWE